MYKLGWFSTGRGRGSRDLLKAAHEGIKSGEIKAQIEFVFCSREPGEYPATDQFIKMVEDYRIPVITFSYRKFKSKLSQPDTNPDDTLAPWRLDYDREVMAHLKGFQPDLCVLAGYMLIVGKEMCQKYNMVNLHPAVPGGPTGTWREVIWQLIETGAAATGAMMHLVTPKLDMGPPVTYFTLPIRGGLFDQYRQELKGRPLEQIKKEQGENNPLFKLIREQELAREFPLIVATIKAFSQGRIKITSNKKLVDARGRPVSAYNLTDEIDRVVKPNIT